MGIPDHLTCLLRNLYTGQEAAVRTAHETTDSVKFKNKIKLKQQQQQQQIIINKVKLFPLQKKKKKQLTGSNLGKEHGKVVYCHLAYVTYM